MQLIKATAHAPIPAGNKFILAHVGESGLMLCSGEEGLFSLETLEEAIETLHIMQCCDVLDDDCVIVELLEEN